MLKVEHIDAEQVRRLIESNVEPTEPGDTIARVLAENVGKQITIRLERKLKDATGRADVRIRYRYGMTQVEWTAPWGEQSLLLAHRTTSVYVPADFKEKNPSLYSARDERNAKRAKLLADGARIEAIVDAINSYRDAKATLQALVGDDVVDVAGYTIEKAAGLRE